MSKNTRKRMILWRLDSKSEWELLEEDLESETTTKYLKEYRMAFNNAGQFRTAYDMPSTRKRYGIEPANN